MFISLCLREGQKTEKRLVFCFTAKPRKAQSGHSKKKKKKLEDFQKQDDNSHATRGSKDILNVKQKLSFS